MNDKIIVLDYGSQYNQLIVRRMRELGVYSELVSHTILAKEIQKDPSIKGIILSGGPHAVYEEDSFQIDADIFNLDIPVLGICYGMQLMMHTLGGKVKKGNHQEYGKTTIHVTLDHPLTNGLNQNLLVWMSHGDIVEKLGKDFIETATSTSTPYVMVKHLNKPLYGIQFHPEVSHTPEGMKMLDAFVNLTHANRTWDMKHFIDQKIDDIKTKVLDKDVILGLSGGVDSSVAAALLDKAIGKQLTCIFVDQGLLRLNEGDEVESYFRRNFNLNFIRVDAKALFLKKLKGVSDPEEKRKIIGNTFIEVFDEEVKKLTDVDFLAQGTLYTDLIESGTKSAQKIKSHHNVGGLPEHMKLSLIEPLNTLFKDEVRVLGLELNLEHALVYRQPFPGPGLAIRIIGDITEDKIRIVQESDAILREVFKQEKLNETIWQYFTVLTSVQTVGVKGDQRSYEYVLAIRAVSSIDGMTADFAYIPYEILSNISSRITNEVSGVGRVVYDITSKPPGTIEWE
ncbi:glutamine-hydrolyzing GMP synthase [Mycoplasmatota bacterium]|nr:glutamine-hydrolyzing GMP synthase [Mycoplasmatota bacterium]